MTNLTMQIVIGAFVFIFGSIIGSFLNVVILRTPLKQSIITEPSHCFSCGNRLKWYDMFPIFSWLILRGRCRFCKAPISPRYMIFEAITAALYLLAYLCYGFSWEFGYAAVLFPVLVVLSGIDIDHFQIPYWCSGVVAVLGIASFFVFPEVVWYERLISLAVVGVVFFILVLVGGMGGGDLQLMLGASLLLGFNVFPALLIGIVLGAVYGSIKKIRDRKVEKETAEKIKKIVEDWYQEQLDSDIGYVKDDCDDIIVGSISDGNPDIEWEFLEEKAWQGIPDKSKLTKALRENIKNERDGGFRIFIEEDRITKVKYSRHMVFGPFLAVGIATSWLVGDIIVNWYIQFFQ